MCGCVCAFCVCFVWLCLFVWLCVLYMWLSVCAFAQFSTPPLTGLLCVHMVYSDSTRYLLGVFTPPCPCQTMTPQERYEAWPRPIG